jgi:hypothetical protein
LVFGPLNNFSAFPFENELGHIKRCVKGTSRPLEELSNHVHRKHELFLSPKDVIPDIKCIGLQKNGIPRAIIYKNVRISFSHPDCYFLSKSGHIFCVNSFLKQGDSFSLLCSEYTDLKDYFVYPCESSKVGIFLRPDSAATKLHVILPLSSIYLKYVCLQASPNEIFIPVLFDLFLC